MTQKEAMAACRAMGITLRYSAEYGEYRVYPKGNGALAYFTNDRDDAVATARAMVEAN